MLFPATDGTATSYTLGIFTGQGPSRKPTGPKRSPGQHARKRAMSMAEKQREKRQAKYDWYVASADPHETEFRHMHWHAKRKIVRQTLAETGSNEFALNRFDECGSECVVEWSEIEQRYRLVANHCRCRHCEPCAKAKAGLLTKNLRAKQEGSTEGDHRFRFITLTLRHTRQPLELQLKKLYDFWRELRKTKAWKNSQKGGAAILECKGGNYKTDHGFSDGLWHPHLHIIAEGDWLDQRTLSREWQRITGGSTQVDIKAIKTSKDAAFYVAKYVGKGTNDAVWNDAKLRQEYVLAMKGVRTMATFGTWRSYKLLSPHKELQAKDWVAVDLLRNVCERAVNGSEVDALLIIKLGDAFQYNPHKPRKTLPIDKPPE